MTKIRRSKYNDLAPVAQSAPSAVEFEEIASGSVELPTNPNKAIFLDDLDNQMKVIDSGGVITELGGGGSGGLGLAFIDHTNVPAELIRNTEYVCDFSGATTDLDLILPEGTGSETFRIAVTLTKVSSTYAVNVNTTNSQVIALPTLPDTETITNITEATAFAVEFDQTKYNWKDSHFPTFANLTGSVPFDEITVQNDITVLGEITDGVLPVGSVIKSTSLTDYSIPSTYALVPSLTIDLTEGVWLVKSNILVRGTSGSSTFVSSRIYNNSDATVYTDSLEACWIVDDAVDPINKENFLRSFETITIAKGETKTIHLQVEAAASSRGEVVAGDIGNALIQTSRLHATKIATVSA